MFSCFFFTDTATTEIYTLSLHDALPIFVRFRLLGFDPPEFLLPKLYIAEFAVLLWVGSWTRSEEHTSELQSHSDLVCRLLLEKKKKYAQANREQNAN